jgi:2-(1,2-epoxy-1,2-dihydrophenyl)acetyl-CoA isomerase
VTDQAVGDDARLRVERVGNVLRIVLARPDRGNAVDYQFAAELQEAAGIVVRDHRTEAEIGAVVIVSEGKNFCVGGDVRAFAAAAKPDVFVTGLAGAFHRSERTLVDLPVPVIVAVQGWAAGIGLSLVLAADLVLMERSAGLRAAYTAIGLSPDGGMSWTLPRAVGHPLAMDMLLTNRPLLAEEALAGRVASRVIDDGTAMEAGFALADELATGPLGAHAAVKSLVIEGRERSFTEQLALEARSIGDRAATAEGREGVAAFLERRKPDYAKTADAHNIPAAGLAAPFPGIVS